jgi:RNA polymerase sigma-70 factor (ECF subfamily)
MNVHFKTELILPAPNKDIAVFSGLYDKYAPALYGVILKLTPDVRVANSILEKSFIKIWDELNGYDISRGRHFCFMLRITLQVSITEMGYCKKRFDHLFAKVGYLNLLQEETKDRSPNSQTR